MRAERGGERQRDRRRERQRDEARAPPVTLPGHVGQEQPLHHQRHREQLMAVHPEQVRERHDGQRQRSPRRNESSASSSTPSAIIVNMSGAQHHPALQREQRQDPEHVKARPLAERAAPADEQQERRDPANRREHAEPLPASGAKRRPHRRLKRRVLLKHGVAGEGVAERVERGPVAGLEREARGRQVPGEVHGHRPHQRQRDRGEPDQPPHQPDEAGARRLVGRGNGALGAGRHGSFDYRRVSARRPASLPRSRLSC